MPPSRSRFAEPLLLAFGPIATAALSVWLGQSMSWDLRNYHWYNPYALLNGRIGFDIAVAHHATYYNPVIDLPLWLVGNAAPAWVAAAFLGLVQGLNFSFLYLLARDALAPELILRRGIAALLALLGVAGGFAVILVGTTYYDNTVSVPVIAALWLIVKHRVTLDAGAWRVARRIAIIVGLLAGLAVGLKLPTAPFGVGIVAAIAFAPSLHGRRLAVVAACGLAAFASLMVVSGWWFFVLWRETGNPIFPYFNDLIGSSLMLDVSYRDTRYIPATLWDAVLLPFRFAQDWHVSSDWLVNDWRIAFAYVAVPFGALLLSTGLTSSAPITGKRVARILFAFAIFAYLPWLKIFSIYRYITALEMVAPLLIVAAIGALPLAMRWRGGLAAGTLAAMVALTTLYAGDRTPFTSKMVEVGAPKIARPHDTMALMTGYEPMAFVIPFFPPDIAFLRVDGFLVGPESKTPYLKAMTDRIEAHLQKGGDLFTLYVPYEQDRGDGALDQVGLTRTADCTPVESNIGPTLFWCRVVRS